MPKCLYIAKCVLIITAFLLGINKSDAQCSPPSSGTCEETVPFCSLDQMNGYNCNNSGYTYTILRPGCASCCESYRTWWSFVSNGGNVTITFNVGTCNSCINCNFGLVFGIWGDCQCTEEIACTPGCISSSNSKTYQVNLKPCKTYYISVDACCLCICDFTINTSGGNPPNLFIGNINNKTNGIIEPVCQGYCGYKFFVDPGGCEEANYTWTLDGVEVGGKKPEIQLDFSDAGDFRLCVTATLGNPYNGFICQQQGPTCTTVKVRPLPDRNGVPRTLCYEAANPGGYKWHSQTIFTSGVYRENYIDNNCCPYDSVVQFTVLPEPSQADVYYITCNNTPYQDALGRRWTPCRNQEVIDFPKFTVPNKCDSSIRLTAVNVDFAPDWKATCTNSKVELSPNVSILKPCEVGESYEFEYRWYRKNDTLQKTISTDERLTVDSVQYNYCVDVSVKVRLGTTSMICSKTFCESFNEYNLISNKINLGNDTTICKGAILKLDATITGGTYLWQDNSTDSIFIVKGPGVYWVNATNNCGTTIDTIIITEVNCQTDSCETLCKNIDWMKWSIVSNIKYSGKSKKGSAIISFDLLTQQINFYDLILTNKMFKPTDLDSIPFPWMARDQTRLIHKIYLDSLVDPSMAFILVGQFPNSNLTNSNPQTQKLRAYDSFGNQLDLPNVCEVFQDLLRPDNPVTVVSFGANEIRFDVHNLTNNDGGIVILKGFPVNTSFLELEHFSERTSRIDGVLINVGLLDCCVPSIVDTNFMNICDSVKLNGKTYTQSGMYQQVLQTANGCDSILNLDLSISSSSQKEYSQTDCDSVIFNGKVYKQSGDYTERFTSSNGCDSIIVLHVNIPNSNTTPYALTRCDSVTINNVHYTQSGKYTQQLTSVNGCDSILNIELKIGRSGKGIIGEAGCDSVMINNITYKQSGTYQQKLQTAEGCDSTLNINLTIQSSSQAEISQSDCDSVVVNGQTYKQTGIYTQTLSNANQCDSILTINFTRLNSSSSDLNIKSCDSAEVNSQVYIQSGNYIQTLSNANGCDSILNLEIEIQSSSQSDYSQTACDSVSINGQTYFQSGSYRQLLTAANGCDSILNLKIEVWKSGKEERGEIGCDSVTVNNIIFTQSGLYQQLLQTVHGCDSILNLKIEIRKGGEEESGKTGCDSIVVNNITYTQSGIYKQILQSTNGCDSTLTLDLTIKPGNPSTLDAGKDTSICEGEILKLNGIFNGPASFKWQGARGNFDYADRLSTNYYSNSIGNERIYLFAEDDCKQWLDSLDLQILPNQFVQVTGDTIIDPCNDKEIKFTATGGTNYIWSPNSNIECLDPPCSHVLLKSNLASRFTITTEGPCAFPANLNLSLSETQSDVYLPNAFSPNGDNINDIFLPIFNCEAVAFYNLQIFDRWGNLLFESNDQNKGWDGRQQDEYLNPGVYPYVLQYELHGTGNKVKSGDVTIIR